MFLSKKQTIVRIAALIVFVVLIAAGAAFILYYYPRIHVLNSPQSYKGIFI